MDKCSHCPIRTGCDWLSEMCRLTPREVAQRPHLTLNRYPIAQHSKEGNDAKRAKRVLWLVTEFQPDRSLAVKYDGRRKPDSPKRQYDRLRYRKQHGGELPSAGRVR